MDDGLDDLFGDEHLGQVPAVPDLPSVQRGLIQSTDDSRVSGCSQYVRLPDHLLRAPPECHLEELPGQIKAALPIFLSMDAASLSGVYTAIPPPDYGASAREMKRR